MERFWHDDRRLATALAASLLLHALFALLVPNVRSAAPAPDALETISFTKIEHVSVRAPKPSVAAPAHAIAAKTVVTPKQPPRAAKPRPSAKPLARSRARTRVRPTPGAAAPSHAFAVARQAGTPAPPTRASPSVTAAAPVQTPAAAPAHTADRQVARSAGTSESGGAFAFGDVHPATLDPAVNRELLRRFNVHAELLVSVSDDGKTQSVEFHPGLDPAIEHAIRELLKDAHWDAAVCGGGLTCEWKGTIKLPQ